MTSAGVYRELDVPLPALGTISIPIYSGEGQQVDFASSMLGPVVRLNEDGKWSASWICGTKTVSKKGSGNNLSVACKGTTHQFRLSIPAVLAAQQDMPEKVAVLSDIEGNHAFLVAALREAQVIDEANRWIFGKGHLVILGDAVDRGRDVFPTLWLLHQLAVEAETSGGAVHLVHGNHEQYMLRGNYSRAHPDMIHALKRLGGPAESFGRQTMLGEWLRNQPVALQLGKVVFVHGGIATDILTPGIDLASLNAYSRAYWTDTTLMGKPSPLAEAVFGTSGITQYRGYIMDMPELYGRARSDDVEQVLSRLNASQIVIAHTVVGEISKFFDTRVIAVNVNDDASSQQMIMFDKGSMRVVDLTAKRNLATDKRSRHRDFDLFSAQDWAILASVWYSGEDLAKIPHPY